MKIKLCAAGLILLNETRFITGLITPFPAHIFFSVAVDGITAFSVVASVALILATLDGSVISKSLLPAAGALISMYDLSAAFSARVKIFSAALFIVSSWGYRRLI